MAITKEAKYKLYITIGLLVFLAMLLLFVFSGSNFELLKSIFLDDLSNEELRETLSGFGWRGYITVAMLSMLQVVCAFLPAEPVQPVPSASLPPGLRRFPSSCRRPPGSTGNTGRSRKYGPGESPSPE